MGRAAGLLAALLLVAPPAFAAEPPVPWDGVNPFNCELQQAGFGGVGPDPAADPYCIEFDKRRQNVTELGLLEFLSKEPERVAAASPKCFYFQSDHWRGSVVQDNAATKTYEWDGHYFFDKAVGDGGVWVTNFNLGGQTGDPRELPGFPPEWDAFFGPGTGGFRSRNSVEADPRCAERARRDPARIYRVAAPPPSRCVPRAGRVRGRRLGPGQLGDTETNVRKALGPPVLVKRGFLRWCVAGGGRFLVGQRSDRSGDLGEGGDERTVMLLSTARGFRYRGLRPGSSLRSLRRALPRSRRALRDGSVTVYLARRRSAVLLGVRRGRVRFLALRDRRAVRGARALRAYLRRAG